MWGAATMRDAEKVILVDADLHEDGANGKSKADYVKRAAKFGVWKKFEHLVIPRAEVKSITRLGDVHEAAVKAQVAKEAPPVVAEIAVPKPAAATGDKPIVSLTPNAQVEVKRLIDDQAKPGLGLRLGVKGGGCSGFSYKLEFDQKKEGDVVVPFEQFNVYLDRKSTIICAGLCWITKRGSRERDLSSTIRTRRTRADAGRVFRCSFFFNAKTQRRKMAKTQRMKEECDFSKGVRGKYYKCYRAGTNVIILDSDVSKAFPTPCPSTARLGADVDSEEVCKAVVRLVCTASIVQPILVRRSYRQSQSQKSF